MATGKRSRAISDRSGVEFPYSEMVIEPGTNLFVHYTETDGKWNRVDHPQNYPPREIGDDTTIPNARPDTFEHDLVSTEILDVTGVFGRSITTPTGERIYGR